MTPSGYFQFEYIHTASFFHCKITERLRQDIRVVKSGLKVALLCVGNDERNNKNPSKSDNLKTVIFFSYHCTKDVSL